MKWKKYIEDQYLKGRIPQEWKAKIVFTAETAIEEYKKDLLKDINNILDQLIKQKELINSENKSSYFTRLDTLEEIIKLITK